MNYRRLGKTNLMVSEIGMGTWQLADDPEWGKGPTERESFACLARFMELGGNLIDTAWIYGYREDNPDSHPSEERIGRFLKQTRARDKVVLVTKIPPMDLQWPTRKERSIQDIFPKQHIFKCVNDSLRCLQTDYIDVMLFHVWRDEFNNSDEWKETCIELSREGKVRFWGVSPDYYHPEECLETLKADNISVVQCIFNVFHQKPIDALFPAAKQHDIGIMACAPLDEGGLTDKIHQDTVFAEGDFRAHYFAGERLGELDKRIDALRELLGEEARTIPELALKFILAFDAISTVMPGMRNLKNIDLNMSLSNGAPLSPALLKKLREHAWERNFYPWAS